MRLRRTLPLALFLLALLLIAGSLLAKEPELPGSWRGADVTVDGDATDWSGALVPVPGQPLSIGVRNDASFLYLCIRTADEAMRGRIEALGLSVWLDASGKEDRAFGVRYPAGKSRGGEPDLPDSGDASFQRQLDAAALGATLRILHKGDPGNAMSTAEARPIEAALGEEENALVIELKVPLAFSVDSPIAVETAPGRTIALGLETTEPKGSGASRGGGTGFHFGGAGHGGGQGGGGRHGGGGGEGGGRSDEKAWGKPLKVWFSVPLAKEPARPPA